MTAGRAYRGERCMGGQLVYRPGGDVLDKHLHVLRRAPGGFDWGPEADEARIDQLAIALNHYKEFAEFLREELEGDEWRLPTSDISADTWSREIDVAGRVDRKVARLLDGPLEGGIFPAPAV